MRPDKPNFEDKGQESLHQSSKSAGRQVGEVSALSSDGRGIVHSREKIYFAERVVPGDRVAFSANDTAKPPIAEQVKVLRKSTDRCEHPCRHAKECPASEWGIISYEKQLSEKTELVRRVLRGVVSPAVVAEMWPSPSKWGYRNRLTLQLRGRERGGADLGYAVGARGAGFAEIRNCLLGTKTVGQALGNVGWALRDARELPKSSFPDRISFYETDWGAGLIAIFKGSPDETDVQNFLKFARIFEVPGGVWIGTANLAGVVGERGRFWREEESRSMLTTWLGKDLSVHPAGFAQVNEGATHLVLEHLQEQRERLSARTVWDLYGGYGALGFAAAVDGARVEVVEQNALSKKTFEHLAAMNPSVEAEFHQGEVARLLPRLSETFSPDDLVILDPPRSGCHPSVLKLLGDSRIKRIAYLSCNPARLSRDLKILATDGFQAVQIQPVDFFPQTPEIEALAMLER